MTMVMTGDAAAADSEPESFKYSHAGYNGGIGQSSHFEKVPCESGRYVKRAIEVMQRRTSPLLKLLTDSELQALAISCSYFTSQPETVLSKEGDKQASMYFVVKGVFSVFMESAGNRRNSVIDSYSSDRNSASEQDLSSSSASSTKMNAKTRNLIEIMRVCSGESVNELCLLEGKPCEATIKALIPSVVLEINAGNLVSILSSRPEMEAVILSGERTMIPMPEQLKKLWGVLIKESEFIESANLSRIELGNTRLRVHKRLLQSDLLVCCQLHGCPYYVPEIV